MPTVANRVGNFFKRWKKDNEPVSVDVVRKEGEDRPREASIQQIKQGYGEVMETMQSVRKHLEVQSERSGRMLEVLENLPDVLKTLPEATRDQTRTLDALRQNIEKQNETSAQLTSAITGLTNAAGQQRESMDRLHEHMEEENESRKEVRDSLQNLDKTLGDVRSSSESSRDALLAVANESRGREEQTREMFRRSQRTSTVLMAVTWALAIAALAVAGYVAVQVTRSVQTPTTPPTTETSTPAGGPTSDARTAQPRLLSPVGLG